MTLFVPIALATAGLFGMHAPAFAEVISVNFGGGALFNETGLLPGDTKIQSFTVENHSDENQHVGLRTINESDSGLASAIEVRIWSGVGNYFSGTLHELFDLNYAELGTLPQGSSETFSMSATFRPSAGNDYQNKGAGFDLCVGFVGGEENCMASTGEPGGQNPGTGGGSQGGGSQQPAEPTTETPLAPSVPMGGGASPEFDLFVLQDAGGGELGDPEVAGASTMVEEVARERGVERGGINQGRVVGGESRLGAAALFGLPTNFGEAATCLSIFLLVLLVVALLSLGLDALRDARVLPDRERILGRAGIVILLLLNALMLALIIPISCVVPLLILSILVMVVVYIISDTRIRRKERVYLGR